MIKEVSIEFVPQEAVIGSAAVILDLDLSATTQATLKAFESPFSCATELYGSLQGFVTWFDVTFATPTGPLVLSTSPFEMYALPFFSRDLSLNRVWLCRVVGVCLVCWFVGFLF